MSNLQSYFGLYTTRHLFVLLPATIRLANHLCNATIYQDFQDTANAVPSRIIDSECFLPAPLLRIQWLCHNGPDLFSYHEVIFTIKRPSERFHIDAVRICANPHFIMPGCIGRYGFRAYPTADKLGTPNQV
jgi:hypothetical protein